MFSTFLRNFRYPNEFALLLALILFVPLFEVPKNILLGLYAIVWFTNRWLREGGDHGGRWDGWDSLFALWIASAYVAAAFAGLQKHEWQAISDVWKYVCIAWMLKRSGYGEAEWRAIYASVAISTFVATAWGLIALAIPHKYAGIELHSVGHVNHSAAYIAITVGAALAALISYWSQLSLRQRIAGTTMLFIFGVALILASSRAATVVTLAIVILVATLWARRSRSVLLALGVAFAVFIACIQTFDTEMHRKNELARASQFSMLNERYPLWNQALIAWRAYPLFGVGMDNFDEIDKDSVRRWVEENGEIYDATHYGSSSHAHSLYLTTLAERGIVGLSVVIAAMLAWVTTLLRSIPRTADPPSRWMLWGGAAAACIATFGIGLVNTTLHHEHGLLAMLLLGCWLGANRTGAAPEVDTVLSVPTRLDHRSIGD